MNLKERILKLNLEHTGETIDINDVLITIVTKFQLFEPCSYMSEDEEWVDMVIVSQESDELSQPLCIRKSEITSFGIFKHEEIDVEFVAQKASEDLYQ